MQRKLLLYSSDSLDPYRNLAAEEYLTERVKEDEIILFLWQNAKTVVIGRNQDARSECDLDRMQQEGCLLSRRISGGGAVFHDLGNLNFTFVSCRDCFNVLLQTEVILQALRMLGIQAERNGRNDLHADGKKFSGHAFFHSGGRSYHHGTLMIDVDKDSLSRYLMVSEKKLQSKGVRSVRSRVINLKELLPNLTVEKMKEALQKAFLDLYDPRGVYFIEKRLIEAHNFDPAFETLYQKYKSPEWLYKRQIPGSLEIRERMSWGEVQIHLLVRNGRIRDCRIDSDSLETEVFPAAEQLLKGLCYNREKLLPEADNMVQREPSVWSAEQKQILRDILSLAADTD